MKLRERLEVHVTWKELMFLLGSFAAAMLLLQAQGLARAETIAEKASASSRAAVTGLEAKVDTNKAEMDAGLNALRGDIAETRKDNQALYQFLLTQKRQPRLEQ